MSNRGMKKWAPYSSLIEQSSCLEKMRYEKNKIEKPKIAREEAEKINKILQNYHGQEVTIKYFYNGYIYELKTVINSINKNAKTLIVPAGKIPFSEIVDLIDKDYLSDFDNFIS